MPPALTNRERILAASRGQPCDRLPFFHYWRHCQVGWAERQTRNRGMGMCWVRPPFIEIQHDTRMTEEYTILRGRPVARRTYTTPLGAVSQAEYREPGTYQWHANRSWRDSTPWLVEHLIKTPDDYRVARYIAEHTEYAADYFPIEQALDWLGDEGLVLASLPHSPLQTLLISWIGTDDNAFYYHLADYHDLIEPLYQALKARLPLYEIAARSPAPAAMHGDNVDGWMISPGLFERCLMPVYESEAAALHACGTLMPLHLDGRLANLKALIIRAPVDIIDGFHPVPMGDLPLREALDAWPDKTLWLGYPGAVYEQRPRAVQSYTLELMREALPGERLAVIMSSENLVSNANLLALIDTLARLALPLTEESLARAAHDLPLERSPHA